MYSSCVLTAHYLTNHQDKYTLRALDGCIQRAGITIQILNLGKGIGRALCDSRLTAQSLNVASHFLLTIILQSEAA